MVDPQILEAFNNIKNRIYKKRNYNTHYDFQELAEILVQDDWSEDEKEVLKAFKQYVNSIKFSVEDLGSKIIDVTTLDLSNKIRLEEFIKDIILIIDEFVDSLVAITNIIEFDDNRINIEMSQTRLKSLRNSLIQKMNEYNRKVNGITLDEDQTKFMRVLLTDIIDSIVEESFKLRIQKLSDVLNTKI